MGGTDITCGISGLPIQDGEPMRFIFLRHPYPNYSGTDFPGSMWMPIGLPVVGTYNFYRTAKVHEHTPLVKLTAELIGRYAQPLPGDEYTDYGDLQNFPNTIESLMAACQLGFLTLEIPPEPSDEKKDRDRQPLRTRVAPFYVSEEMYQACIHNIEDDGKGVSTFRKRLTPEPRKNDQPGGALRSAFGWPKRREEMRALHERVGVPDENLIDMMGQTHLFGLRDLTAHLESTPDILVSGRNNRPDVARFKSLAEFGEDDWKAFDQAALNLRVFDFTLRFNLRRIWYPTLVMGQYHFPDDELISHRMLVRKIEEQAVAIEQRYLDENPDYKAEMESRDTKEHDVTKHDCSRWCATAMRPACLEPESS